MIHIKYPFISADFSEHPNPLTLSPEIIDALSNQLMDPLTVLHAEQSLNQLQLPLQLFNAHISHSWRDATFKDLLHRVLDVLQVPLELAHRVVPQLEARMTLDAVREDASEATSALIAVPPRCSLLAHARTCHLVTLRHLRAQMVALTLWWERDRITRQ